MLQINRADPLPCETIPSQSPGAGIPAPRRATHDVVIDRGEHDRFGFSAHSIKSTFNAKLSALVSLDNRSRLHSQRD